MRIYNYCKSYCLFCAPDSMCMGNSTNSILYNKRCYVKYENETLTWYKARERCINYGGDLAQFQPAYNPYSPPFSTSWLSNSLTYWVGIRWKDWSWKPAGVLALRLCNQVSLN